MRNTLQGHRFRFGLLLDGWPFRAISVGSARPRRSRAELVAMAAAVLYPPF